MVSLATGVTHFPYRTKCMWHVLKVTWLSCDVFLLLSISGGVPLSLTGGKSLLCGKGPFLSLGYVMVPRLSCDGDLSLSGMS